MRSSILSISFLFSTAVAGQVKSVPDSGVIIKVTPTFSAFLGKTYIDSVEMDISKTYLDPDNIGKVRYYKKRDAVVLNGKKKAILITRKKHEPFINLSDIRAKSIMYIDTSFPIVYIIDGMPTDTASVRLEATAIKSIDIIKVSDKTALLHGTKHNVILLTTKISSRSKNGY